MQSKSSRFLVAGLGLALVITIPFYILNAHTPGVQQTQPDEWALNTTFGFPYRVARNETNYVGGGGTRSGFGTRSIYVLLEAQYFKEENLRRLFTGLAEEYNQPHYLAIKAFSNIQVLESALNSSEPDSVTSDLNHRQPDHNLMPEMKSVPETSFQAFYDRRDGGEYFYYTPDPIKRSSIKVRIKSKPIVYSGNLNADLLTAVEEEDIEKIKPLLDQGAAIEAKDEEMNTVLMVALLRGDSGTANLLLTYGASVHAVNKAGWTPLLVAASHGDNETIKNLLKRGAGVNAKNSDIESVFARGDTALILAAEHGHSETVQILLANGADVNAKNKNEDTPLMRAAANLDAEIVKILLSKGANVNAKNKKGETALSMAEEVAGNESVLALLKKGAAGH